jgi:hypothetical protein
VSKKPKAAREPFVMIPVDVLGRLLELPSVGAFRMWMVLEIENAEHRGKRNGSLIATYKQLHAAGVTSGNMALKAIRALEAAGVIEVVERGGWKPGAGKRPSLYRLRHHPDAPATDGGKIRHAKRTAGRRAKCTAQENPSGVQNAPPEPECKMHRAICPSTTVVPGDGDTPREGTPPAGDAGPTAVAIRVETTGDRGQPGRPSRLGSQINGVRARLNGKGGSIARAIASWTAPPTREAT